MAEARHRNLAWEFAGYVDDVRPYVSDADVSIVPLLVGGGTRLKVYEAMAVGCPVVATTIGVEGLPVAAGEQYLRADTAEDFSTAVLALLSDPALRKRLTVAARRFVAENCSPTVVGRAFEEICLNVVRDRVARPATGVYSDQPTNRPGS